MNTAGAVAADLDGDGLTDLLATNGGQTEGGANRFYRNNGDGSFALSQLTPVTTDIQYWRGAIAGDFDNNGKPDLYVTSAGNQANALFWNENGGGYSRGGPTAATAQFLSSHSASAADYDRDGWLDIAAADFQRGVLLFRNTRGRTFENTTARLNDTSAAAFGVAWGDFDDDGWPDLFIGNDAPSANRLMRNQRDGSFAAVGNPAITGESGRSGAWGDFDNDGDLDLVTGHFGLPILYVNTGGVLAKADPSVLGLTQGEFQAAVWGDYDNDGWMDLVVSGTGNRRFLRNMGNSTFSSSESSSISGTGANSTLVTADFNNDGFLDLFSGTWQLQNDSLFLNQGNGNKWLRVRCLSSEGRDAIGAKVRITATIAGTARTLRRDIFGGQGYWGMDEPIAHFGLGDASIATTVRIEWPRGGITVLPNVPANQLLVVEESDTLLRPVTTGPVVNDGIGTATGMWADLTGDGLTDLLATAGNGGMNRFYRNLGNSQFELSLLGPITSEDGIWRSAISADFDNDGFADVYAARLQGNNRLYWFGDGGTISLGDTGGLTGYFPNAHSASAADFDRDGLLDIAVGDIQTGLFLFRNKGARVFENTTANLGPTVGRVAGVSWGDYDDDGWPDLFVAAVFDGGRNYLYRNQQNGTFVRDDSSAVSAEFGRHNSASWGDFDNDGDLDLFVGIENQPKLFINDGGSFSPASAGVWNVPAGSGWAGSWGDYDNDGDLDLAMGGEAGRTLLRNEGNGTFATRPLSAVTRNGLMSGGLAWADINKDGFLDLFAAAWETTNDDLYINQGNGNGWLRIRCIGKEGRDAIGAKVRVTATINGAAKTQRRDIFGGQGYMGMDEPIAHFGLGNAPLATKVEISWPSGTKTELANVAANQVLTIDERAAIITPAANTVEIGGVAVFEATSTLPNPAFQWEFNGAILPQATLPYLALRNVRAEQAGEYRVIISGGGQSVSAVARLAVTGSLAAGLVGHWAFENDTSDSSGRGNNGALEGNGAFAEGKLGRGLHFTGNSSVRIPASSSLNVGAAPGLTLSMWIAPENLTQPKQLIEWIYNGSSYALHFTTHGASGAYPNVSGHYSALNTYLGESARRFTPTDELVSLGRFQHVATTYDKTSGLQKTYVDGRLVDYTFLGAYSADTMRDISIGSRPDAPIHNFIGTMDEVKVYERALSTDEIIAEVNRAKTYLRITQHPTGGDFPARQPLELSVTAEGLGALSYQWFFKENPIQGATGRTHTIANPVPRDSGAYSVRVTNAAAEILSEPANVAIYWDLNMQEVQAGQLTSLGGFTSSIAIGDYDNDGWNDVFLPNFDIPNTLLRNDRNGSFSVVNAPPTRPVLPAETFQGSTFVDYNNDGFLDLFVSSEQGVDSAPGVNLLYKGIGGGQFAQVTTASCLASCPNRTVSAGWGDLDGDGWLDVVLAFRDGPKLGVFRNDTIGDFIDMTEAAAANIGAGVVNSVALADFDLDGDLDILTAGGLGAINLFRNLGNFRFEAVPNTGLEFGNDDLATCRWVDIDNDGDFDAAFRSFIGTGKIFENRGGGAFGWLNTDSDEGRAYADLNLDGRIDPVAATVSADMNHDGIPDTLNVGSPNEELFLNQGNGASWMTVRLRGRASNRFGIGAKIRAFANVDGRGTAQLRQITSGDGYGAASPAEAYFGFSDATAADRLVVEWPSGGTSELRNVPVNQILTIDEDWARITPAVNSVLPGGQAVFEAITTLPNPTYRWELEGETIPGANLPYLIVPNVRAENAGEYQVVITSGAQTVAATARLTLVESLSSGLVAHWPFEDNAQDASGNGNHGFFDGNVAFRVGSVGRGLWLFGIGEVHVPASASLNVGTAGGFTVSAWLTPDDLTRPNAIVEWLGSVSPYGAHFYFNGAVTWTPGSPTDCSGVHLNLAGGSDPSLPIVPGVLTQAVRQHVAVTYDKSTGIIRHFVNARLVNLGFVGSHAADTARDLFIGSRPFANPTRSMNFSGVMDEVKIFQRALSSEEVMAEMNRANTHLNITTHPFSGYVRAGQRLQLVSTAEGLGELSYQWLHNGVPIQGATSPTYTLDSAQPRHEGAYSVRVTGPTGSVLSDEAHIAVDTGMDPVTTGPLANLAFYSSGAAWADLNQDETPDLLVLDGGNAPTHGQNRLFRNNAGEFSEATAPPFTTELALWRGVAVADLNNDSLPDVYFTPNGSAWPRLAKNEGALAFTGVSGGAATGTYAEPYGASIADFNSDGLLDIFMADWATGPHLFRNTGAFQFDDVTSALAGRSNQSVGVAAADFDNDGASDLLVMNVQAPPHLFRNLGDGRFERVNSRITSDGVNYVAGSWGDLDRDGDLDLLVGYPLAIYVNNGAGNFEPLENPWPYGTDLLGRGNTASWADYDNDGWLDIVAGGPTGLRLYQSVGGVRFIERPGAGVQRDESFFGSALAWADYDGNGFLDLFAAGQRGNSVLFRNTGNDHNWLRIRCVTAEGGRDAIGAKVFVTATIDGQVVRQRREILAGQTYNGQDEPIAHFGLGSAAVATEVRIEWPNGIVTSEQNLAARQLKTNRDLPEGTPVVRVNGKFAVNNRHAFITHDRVSVSVASEFRGAIYYTTDGTPPSVISEPYTGPVQLEPPFIFSAVAYSADFGQEVFAEPVLIDFLPSYDVNVTTPGGGSITLDPPGGRYVTGTPVTLRATPQPGGWSFMRWEGDITGATAQTTLTVTSDINARAIFGGNVTVSVTGGATRGAALLEPAAGPYPFGSVVRAMALPAAGQVFANWNGNATLNTSPHTVTIAAPTTALNALFAALSASQRSLAIKVQGSGNVTKTPSQNAYTAGATVSLTPVPDPGWTFTGWADDATGSTVPLQVTMDANKVITAMFSNAGAAPAIQTEPADLARFTGQSASFTVAATGSAPLNYQWWFGNQELSGQTSATLSLPSLTVADNGDYYVVISNPYGRIESRRARLTVTRPPNVLPTVAIRSPLATDSFRAPVNIAIVAEAADPDGTIARVDFQLNGAAPISVTQPAEPNLFSYVWENVPSGANTIIARAYDNEGAFVSAQRDFEVAQPEITSFRFAQPSYTFSENAGVVQIVVSKTGAEAASVSFTTEATTAEVGRDFAQGQGALNFAANESAKTISLTLLNEYVPDGDKQFQIRLLNPTGTAQLGAPSTTTIATLDDDGSVYASSLFDFRLSANRVPEPERGTLQVTLGPPGALGAWRFPWERFWRGSGASAINLDPGSYRIEFRPSAGYRAPAALTANVFPGATSGPHFYTEAAGSLPGGLGVTFAPMNDGAVPQWRLAGEAAWRAGGQVVANLPPGTHVVEFAPVNGWVTPAARQALVQSGIDTTLSITYSLAPPAPAGVTLPAPLTYSNIRNAQTAPAPEPFPMVGQIRSPAGYGSGIAVRDRVVLTAAHVLFDENTTNFVAADSIEWFHERAATEYEPRPLRAAGYYVHENYLAARVRERSEGMAPGVSGPASQEWDIAAIYFSEPAARNGQSGYLYSSAAQNEWIFSPFQKTLAGYPIYGANEGRMHEVRSDNYTFAPAGTALVATPGFLSYPGNSGGPLMVGYQPQPNGAVHFYPAAVYLGSRTIGGAPHSLARVIDALGLQLINRAQSSAELGVNFTGGGIIDPGSGFSQWVEHTIIVNFTPAAGRWRFVTAGNQGAYHPSGEPVPAFAATYELEFEPILGYQTPPRRTITIAPSPEAQTLSFPIAYEAAPRPSFSNFTLTPDRRIRFDVTGAATDTVVIEVASELLGAAASWSPAHTAQPPFTYETPANAPRGQYFRARVIAP